MTGVQTCALPIYADPLGRRVMGDKMATAWLEYKRAEWHAYSVHVTDWEKRRYLKLI